MKTEIEIPVAALKNALPGLAKIVPRHRTLPVLQCIKLSVSAAGLSLQANNLGEIATVRLAEARSTAPGEVLVPLDELTRIIKGCASDSSVRISSDKKETQIRLPVAGSQVERPLSSFDPKEWPAAKTVPGEFHPLDETFKEVLRQAFGCASEDSTRYVLNGACLDNRDPAAHYLVGSDGRHLFCANSFQFTLPEPLIVPTRKFVVWPGFMEDGQWRLRMLPAVKSKPPEPGKKAADTNEEPPWLQIDSDHWSYVARAIDGKFPDWKQIMPKVDSDWTRLAIPPAAAKTILEALPMLPGGDEVNNAVVLIIDGTGLTLKGRGRDQSIDTCVPIDGVQVTGSPVEVSLNRHYLIKALRFGFTEVAIHDPLEPMVFSQDRRVMIVMPLRGEAAERRLAEQKKASASPEQTPTPENAEAAPPSTAPAPTPTDQKENQTMATNSNTRSAVEPATNRTIDNGHGQEPGSAFKTALDHIDRIKTNLRDVLGELGDTVTLLKAAEKEQRVNAREIDSVRAKLREIQSVEI